MKSIYFLKNPNNCLTSGHIKVLTILISLLYFANVTLSQSLDENKPKPEQPSDYIYGYPPTWNALPGPGSGQQPQYLIFYATCNPRINGIAINPGDWIGVFYKNDFGDTVTGGAGEWLGNDIMFIAYGDNSPGALPKNGFGYGEVLNWRFYSWTSQKDYKVPSQNVTYENCVNCVTTNKYYPISFAKITNIFTNISFTVNASASPNSICEGNSSQLNASVSGSYAPYTYSWASNPTGFSSNLKNPLVSPIQTTQYTVTASDGLLNASNSVSVTVLNFPNINAGSDASICQGQTPQLNATATGYSSLLWTTSGDGTFSNSGILNPVYTPGTNDIVSGGTILSLTVYFSNPCTGSKIDHLSLTIQKSPISNAGSDKTSCTLAAVTLSGTASNYSSVSWSSSGTGSFTNANTLSPTYTPSANDVLTGTITITLIANPNNPCTSPASDGLILSLTKLPSANAGVDQSTCGTTTTSISGTASNYSSLNWTTSGTGTFSNPNTQSTTYLPSQADVNSNSVQLTLTAIPLSPCTASASDFMVLNLVKPPTSNAGADKASCNVTPVSFTGSATNYASVNWTSSGTGSFTNANTLSPTYTPSANDVLTGTITITLFANPNNPCTAAASDGLILSLTKLPAANAGVDQSTCGTTSVSLSGIASNYSSLNWTTSGTGTFSNSNSLNTNYLPSQADVNGSSVQLTLTAVPLSPCTASASDFMVLSLVKPPTSNAGTDKASCNVSPVSLTGTATNYASVNWTSTGTGIFTNANTLSPTYTPSANDVLTGTITITLIANPNNPCTAAASDGLILSLTKLPAANAGPDKNTCETTTTHLVGTATSYSSVQWTSSGTGTFTNANNLSTFYMPSQPDLNNGSVIITLSSSPLAPCTASASDFMVLNLVRAPTASAGADLTTCERIPVSLNGSATNYSSVSWQTNGDGIFSSPLQTITNYTPGISDLNTGTVLLTLTANPLAGCSAPFQSSVNLTIKIFAAIVDQPESQSVIIGQNAQFEVFAAGSTPLFYQWYGPSGLISGEDESIFIIENVEESDMGAYYCMVSNYCGSVESESAVLTVLIYHNIVIPAGWSGISSFVNPVNPLVENIFAPVVQNLTILQNDEGIYWPAQQINTLVNWDNEKGYAVKFSQSTQLQVLGSRSTSNLTLNAGWNYLPVLSGCDVSVSELFSGKPEVIYISDIAGNKVYWPQFNIFTLQTLSPGKAYFIKAQQSVNIIFPDCN